MEKGLKYNSLQKRTDLCVYSKEGMPLVLVECKSADVIISAETVKQASVYNQTIKAPYIMLTNGLLHYCWKVNFETQQFQPLAQIPTFQDLI